MAYICYVNTMTKDELVFALKEKLHVSRHALRAFAQNKEISLLLRDYTTFLNDSSPNNVRCWHLIYNIQEIPTCVNCRNKTPKFNNNKWGYLDYCCVKCQRNSPLVKKKLAAAIEKKYGKGVTNPFMADEVKSEIRKKMLLKLGVDHNFKRKDLLRDIMRRKYGVDHYSQTQEFREKYTQTILERYGVNHYSQTQEFLEKCKLTWKSRFGVEHPMHDAGVAERVLSKLHKMKKVTLPNGEIALLQGYEPYALDVLLKTHSIDDIIVEKKKIESYVGKILYKDYDGKVRRYYPDFYIVSSSKIIEVKSTWTYDRNGTLPQNKNTNLLKKAACISSGLLFEFMIIDAHMIAAIKADNKCYTTGLSWCFQDLKSA